jgi:hypothetical protein
VVDQPSVAVASEVLADDHMEDDPIKESPDDAATSPLKFDVDE